MMMMAERMRGPRQARGRFRKEMLKSMSSALAWKLRLAWQLGKWGLSNEKFGDCEVKMEA